MKEKIEYTVSSGNVFKDIGVADPDIALIKSEISREIFGMMKSKNLSKSKAAEMIGITPEKMTDILIGKLKDFTLEKLLRFMNRLGNDIYISYFPKKSKEHGEIHYVGLTEEPINCEK